MGAASLWRHVEWNHFFAPPKYRLEFPERGVADLEAAQGWAARFVRWYNHDHAHSGVLHVSPAQRHAGEDAAILAACHALYQEAKAQHPRRWSGSTRNRSPITVVTLNPERDTAQRRSRSLNRETQECMTQAATALTRTVTTMLRWMRRRSHDVPRDRLVGSTGASGVFFGALSL